MHSTLRNLLAAGFATALATVACARPATRPSPASDADLMARARALHQRISMMVDISHVSKECMLQATALSKAPVVASHSSTSAVANVPRNLDDEQLLAVQRNGGVVQIVAFASYVKVDPPETIRPFRSFP